MSEKIKLSDLPKKTRALILFFTTLMPLLASCTDLGNNPSTVKRTLTPTLDLSGDTGVALAACNQEAADEIASKFYQGAKVNVIANSEKEILLRAYPQLNSDNIDLGKMLTFEHAADVFTVTSIFINRDDPVEWIVFVKISNDSANGWIDAEQLKIIPEVEWKVSTEKSPFEKSTILIPLVDPIKSKIRPLDHEPEVLRLGNEGIWFYSFDEAIYLDGAGKKWIKVGSLDDVFFLRLEDVKADSQFLD